jgi:hypothetical protein
LRALSGPLGALLLALLRVVVRMPVPASVSVPVRILLLASLLTLLLVLLALCGPLRWMLCRILLIVLLPRGNIPGYLSFAFTVQSAFCHVFSHSFTFLFLYF